MRLEAKPSKQDKIRPRKGLTLEVSVTILIQMWRQMTICIQKLQTVVMTTYLIGQIFMIRTQMSMVL